MVFLPLQEEIIGSVMDGKDAFVLMPTGGGKSLCYQLPALARDGLTLVISPLISLMKDQVDALKTNGIKAAFINSSLDQREVAAVGEGAHRGDTKILYVAPERVVLPGFQAFLKTLNVSLIAIDEAHCVSEWGHEFRPAYRELQGLRQVCPKAPVIALTATATRAGKGGRPLPVGPSRASDFRVQFRPAKPDLFRGTQGRSLLRAVGTGDETPGRVGDRLLPLPKGDRGNRAVAVPTGLPR